METKNFTVTGMTCGHCEMSVREEVSEVPGVTAVEVDRNRNFLAVTAEGSVDVQAVLDAVKEAGFSGAEA